MFHRNMDLIILLLAGCSVASSLLPPPLILAANFDRLTEGETIEIACWAPRDYVNAWFYLHRLNQSHPVQILPAAETKHDVTFLLENITTSDGGQYQCQYGVFNGSTLQLSQRSHVLEVSVEGSTLTTSIPTFLPRHDPQGSVWYLPIVLTVVGIVLLLVIIVVIVAAVRHFKERRKKKREMDSCWTQTSYSKRETSFDNSMFTVTMVSDSQKNCKPQMHYTSNRNFLVIWLYSTVHGIHFHVYHLTAVSFFLFLNLLHLNCVISIRKQNNKLKRP